jgi:hypothetical protein
LILLMPLLMLSHSFISRHFIFISFHIRFHFIFDISDYFSWYCFS